jgi:hypothetical protein
MRAPRAEFEQKFIEVLTLRAVTAPGGTMGAIDPCPDRRPGQGGRSPPRRHRRGLSAGSERLPRRPGGLRQQLELHHTAQPGRGTKAASLRPKTDRASLRLTRSEGEDHASAIVSGSYRSVCHRCSRGSPGVGPGPLEQFPAENTARLTTPLARVGKLRFGATKTSTSRSIPLPALCRPPTSHWRAGACVDVGRPHQRLDQPLRGTLRRLASPCGSCGVVPVRGPLPPSSAPQQGNYS